MSNEHELPIHELYRGVEVYGLQSEERIAEAKRQIDQVAEMRSVPRLFNFACDGSRAPEARLLARSKLMEGIEQRQAPGFDRDRLWACTGGIERRCGMLGRLMGARDADGTPGEWPIEWMPWRTARE